VRSITTPIVTDVVKLLQILETGEFLQSRVRDAGAGEDQRLQALEFFQ
jgi:hypothetical protein